MSSVTDFGAEVARRGFIEPWMWIGMLMTLTDVHRVVQAVMGWLDCHLWHFEMEERRYAMRVPNEPEWNERYEGARRAMLGALVGRGVRRMSYVYDMGDFWEHSVILERVIAPLLEAKYPQFLGGERRCPPEDCGGAPG